MKRIIYLLLLIISTLFLSCNKDNGPKVEILVNSDIKIEINEIDNFMWKTVIFIRVDGKDMPYGNTIVKLKENEEVVVDSDVEFVVYYEYNDKTYTKVFTVRIYERINYKFLNLNYLDSNKESISFTEECNLNDYNTYIDGYTFDGWYLDPLFNNKYEDKIVKNNLNLYGKWIKNNEVLKFKGDLNLDEYINYLMESTTSYVPSWNMEGFKGRWNYIDGVFLNSIINMYYATNNSKYIDFVVKYVNYYINSNGEFINPETFELGYKSGELDSVCASRVLFDLYDYTKDDRYLKAIKYTYNELCKMPKTVNGINYSHKEAYLNQIWLDGMYMYVPFLARYAKITNDLKIFDEIKSQYEYIRNYMYDEQKKLYYHGHDTLKDIFWADDTTGNSESFWLRSMGWYVVSLVDVLEYYPKGDNFEYLVSLLDEALMGILSYQDLESKMFYQIIDKGAVSYLVPKEYLEKLKNKDYLDNGIYKDKSISNYLESSGSSMIAYSLMKSSRLGYIDESYFDVGKEIYESIYANYFKNNCLNNICITAGLGPDNNQIRDGSIYYYLAEKVGSNDAKGVGPFIMAYLEYKE